MKKVSLTKRLLSTVLVAAVIVTNSFIANATTKGEIAWSQFRGEALNPGITDSKTPKTSEEIEESWAVNLLPPGAFWGNISDPVVVGDYVYITDSTTVKKVDKATGNIVLEKPLAEEIGFFSRIAYGEGKLFIPVGKGRIQCIDAESLESLWITPIATDNSFQAISPVVYHDGHAYMGVTNGSANNGMFYAVSAKDEDPSVGDEIKDYTWTYAPEEGSKGYYWSSGAVVGNNIIFGGEKGQVVSHNLTDDIVIDTLELNEAIRSSIHYDKDTGRIYISTKAGNIHSIKINSDGTFDKTSLITRSIGKDITSSPVTYNGRLYVSGGGIMSGAGFSVLDANTLEVIYQINDFSSQSSPILTTAYATEENNYEVYLYVFNFSNPDDIYVIKDFQGNDKPIYEKLATPSKPNYNSSSATIDEEGSIYFKNDSGNVFKFINKVDGAFGVNDVIRAINRIANIDDITLNDEIDINNAMYRYNSLSDEDKDKVTNIDKLNKALEKIKDLKNADKEVERLLSEIELLPSEITLANKDKVNELFASYSRLSDEYKVKVTNANKLVEAKNTIYKLEEDELIKSMEAKINKLPELNDVVLDREEEINALYKEFLSLSKDIQNRISNKDLLINSKGKIDLVRKEVDSIEDDIWNKINPENITLEDKAVVNDLITRYNLLDERDKKYIKHFNEVLDAKNKIDKLEAEIKLETKPEIKPDIKPESKPEIEPEIKSDNKAEGNSQGKLPNTGGTNSVVVLIFSIIILAFGVVLFIKNKQQRKD